MCVSRCVGVDVYMCLCARDTKNKNEKLIRGLRIIVVLARPSLRSQRSHLRFAYRRPSAGRRCFVYITTVIFNK